MLEKPYIKYKKLANYYNFVFILDKYKLIQLTRNSKKCNIIITVNFINKKIKSITNIRVPRLEIDSKLK